MENNNGQYLLGQTEKGKIGLSGPQHGDPNGHI
jgi:hypothetical protein